MTPQSEFEEFARATTPSLLRAAYLLTGDQHLAEDLVQTALARTHRYWRRISNKTHAASYTRKTMYHLQVSHWRRRRFKEQLSDTPPERTTSGHADDVDLKLSLRHALAQLTARQRAVVVLRYFEDRSVAETAVILRCSEGSIKSHTFRALNRLRESLPSLTELLNGAIHDR
ncbi:RNA polymerase sigma-70 factor (sigma-E family) [Stackebrandtia endophytica]|uniref:RNA polymerase sigma-70 factor (Sigma-E family) n=1 Tax=Stackebrandtia endophytica TaxID=1496996 RepID=A0A543AWL5_9ACTN|nr:SigE family RNA polymerase sigma factor [Stackebrandtia endophytica]TQL76949.1 RNA polymerase sigma-70 factor (sigma-E family) [Stackebrandtia endophytica]